jgi:hypothetical protein
MRADFIPSDASAKPIHFDCYYERDRYPEDLTEEAIELNAAPATRRHMLDFLAAIDPQRREVVGDAEATRRLRRDYREPWQHPATHKA